MALPRDAKLRRRDAAKALIEAGFPISSATLNTMATRGGGPPYQLWGRFPIYTWGDVLDWAESRLSRPIRTSSELDAVEGASA